MTLVLHRGFLRPRPPEHHRHRLPEELAEEDEVRLGERELGRVRAAGRALALEAELHLLVPDLDVLGDEAWIDGVDICT
ncbi:hypothetical protein WME98_29220 [Sorangium sp. So ce296]|uniref:hypothetical protein n=1 Tax=Sorangium sp. So ce296 TaxID=3133296 RepID=UPI003F62A6D9